MSPQRQTVIAVAAAFVLAGLLGAFIYTQVMRSTAELLAPKPADEAHTERVNSAERANNELVALVDGFTADASAGRFENARARVTPLLEQTFDPDTFERALKAHPYVRVPGHLDVRRVTLRDGAGHIEGSFVTATGALTLVADVSDEGGRWTLTGLSLGGLPVLVVPPQPPPPPARPRRRHPR